MTPVGVEGALTVWARTAPELDANANVKANERTIMDDQLDRLMTEILVR
jgi:hypothetical protein